NRMRRIDFRLFLAICSYMIHLLGELQSFKMERKGKMAASHRRSDGARNDPSGRITTSPRKSKAPRDDTDGMIEIPRIARDELHCLKTRRFLRLVFSF
ncbi:MAG: hypothetical protein MUP19_10100, partial [Candidatus Aminicenantes bacterium]|nr:hypothetical protein [Candidatus Aminicenantes bacterium]